MKLMLTTLVFLVALSGLTLGFALGAELSSGYVVVSTLVLVMTLAFALVLTTFLRWNENW